MFNFSRMATSSRLTARSETCILAEDAKVRAEAPFLLAQNRQNHGRKSLAAGLRPAERFTLLAGLGNTAKF